MPAWTESTCCLRRSWRVVWKPHCLQQYFTARCIDTICLFRVDYFGCFIFTFTTPKPDSLMTILFVHFKIWFYRWFIFTQIARKSNSFTFCSSVSPNFSVILGLVVTVFTLKWNGSSWIWFYLSYNYLFIFVI